MFVMRLKDKQCAAVNATPIAIWAFEVYQSIAAAIIIQVKTYIIITGGGRRACFLHELLYGAGEGGVIGVVGFKIHRRQRSGLGLRGAAPSKQDGEQREDCKEPDE